MKKLLETLNDCLQNATVYTKHTEHDCHITLTDGGNHKIYIRYSALNGVEKTCVATPHLPVDGKKFTRIYLHGKCDLKTSTLAVPDSPHFNH